MELWTFLALREILTTLILYLNCTEGTPPSCPYCTAYSTRQATRLNAVPSHDLRHILIVGSLDHRSQKVCSQGWIFDTHQFVHVRVAAEPCSEEA